MYVHVIFVRTYEQRIEAYDKEQVLKKMEEDNRKMQELQV
jgi:hypothetical protein